MLANGSVNDEVNQSDHIALLLSQATQSNDPIANLFSQTSATVPGKKISARLPGGMMLTLCSTHLLIGGLVERLELMTFQGNIRIPHLENVQEREGQLQIIRTSDMENVSEQLQLDLHHQVLVVL